MSYLRPLFALSLAAVVAGCGSSDDLGAEAGNTPGAGGTKGSCVGCDGPKDPQPFENDLSRGSGGAGGLGGAGPGGGAGGGPQSLPAACNNLPQSPRPFTTASADSNGWASATWAREQLQQPASPVPVGVRTQDFLNYYFVDLTSGNSTPASGSNAPIVSIQLAPSPNVPKLYNLMVALQAPTMPRSPRWVSVVVDTRSSMGAVAIERAQASLVALASSLDQGDHVDLLTTDPSSEPVAFDVDQAGAPALKKLAAALFAGKDEGNLADALTRAYDVAHATPAPANASRRLFMISNGPDDPSTLPTAAIQGNAQQGLLLVSVGTGPALQHGDRTLRAAAKAGRGHYLYVDSAAEAQRVFDQQAGEIFGIAFEDVQLEVQVPWYFELLTDESEVTNTASFDEVDPQNLAAGGHSTLLFKLEACDDSVLAQGDDLSVTVSWRDPSAVERVNHTVATTVPKAMADTTQLDAALAVFSYAEALKTLDSRRLQEALTLTNAGLAKQPGDAHLTEIAALIAKHPALELP